MAEDVTFASDGLTLAGHLRVPSGDGLHPAVVLTGPLSGVKEQVVATYAERLTAAGYVTLAFDHRNFGASGGVPRQHEDPSGKLGDLLDAVSFLGRRDEVDASRIACVGVCLGGGYALRFAATDPRVRAVACIAGGFNDPKAMRAAMGGEAYRALLSSLLEVAQREAETGQTEYWSAVDTGDGGPVVMTGEEPKAYYSTERGAAPNWENRLTARSVYNLVTTDLAGGADLISPTPMLVVHGRGDEYCDPDSARMVCERAEGPKHLAWLDTTVHIDLYDNEPLVAEAVAHVTDWFAQHV